jgi:hypothetical protein
VTGVKDVAALFCVSLAVDRVWVAVTEEFTVSKKVAVAVALFASVTVTVYVAAELRMVGVPVMAPVVEDSVRPAGSTGDTA